MTDSVIMAESPPSLRMGARRPSGRPGARWLRVDRKPLSTERPGPSRVAPADPATLPRPRALDLAPSGDGLGGASPSGPAAFDDCVKIPRSGVQWWTGPNLPATDRTLSTVA